MTGPEPNLPREYRAFIESIDDFHVSELASDHPGALSPFGQDVEFPLPLDRIAYQHPGPEDRPHLAGG